MSSKNIQPSNGLLLRIKAKAAEFFKAKDKDMRKAGVILLDIETEVTRALVEMPEEYRKALEYCDQVEKQLMEVANGQRKPGKVEFQPVGRLIEYIRNGKTYDVTLNAHE